MNGRIWGAFPLYFAADESGTVDVCSGGGAVRFGKFAPADIPGTLAPLPQGGYETVRDGETVSRTEYCFDPEFSAFIMFVTAREPLEYRFVLHDGAVFAGEAEERSRGVDVHITWAVSGGRFLCCAFCGKAGRFLGEVRFSGGRGYAVFCEGDDPNELTARISRVVSLLGQGCIPPRGAFVRGQKAVRDPLADTLTAFQRPDGLVASGHGMPGTDAFTQYLAARAFCALGMIGRAEAVIDACLSRFYRTGGTEWYIDGVGAPSVNKNSFVPSLIILAAAGLPTESVKERYSGLCELADYSAEAVRACEMPFNGCESAPMAKICPERGSAVATAALIASVEKLTGMEKRFGVKLSERTAALSAEASEKFAERFTRNGRPATDSAARTSGLKRKKYRYGYCALCGTGSGRGPVWTVRSRAGGYVCFDCAAKPGDMTVPDLVRPEASVSPLPVLYAAYIGADVYPPAAFNQAMADLLCGPAGTFENGYEYPMFIRVAADSPFFRRYGELVASFANKYENGHPTFADAAYCAAAVTAKNKRTKIKKG